MRIATDIGGTFTDLVVLDDAGDFSIAKSHTTPPNFEEGIIDVIEAGGIEPSQIKDFIHGTTVIINALTEHTGAKCALITTKGFRDVLEIGRCNRPDLYNIRFRKPAPFVERHLRREVSGRMDYLGNEIEPLDISEVASLVDYFKKEDVEAIAVCLLHSYANPKHELAVAEELRRLVPNMAITASVEVTREWREYERTSTAVLNSYVKPVASSYVNRLDERLDAIGVKGKRYIMQSNGGTTSFAQSRIAPINMVESGPVAGVFGSAILGRLLGFENVIAFDVGGTTAKCSLVDGGEVKVSTEYSIARTAKFPGYPLRVPVVDIVEIGNGGGSIAWIDDAGSLRVGPRSAGALPGPVAYGKGGTSPTTTDANLILGRLSPKNFDMEVDMEAVSQALDAKIAKPLDVSVDEAALGVIRIANSNMLNALKLISVRKGYDPRDFALVAFGGGGSLHATALATELGIRTVIVPGAASVFSAWGMLMTDMRQDFVRTVGMGLEEGTAEKLEPLWKEMEIEATARYAEDGIGPDRIVFTRFVDMRYLGQEHTVKTPYRADGVKELSEEFGRLHEKNYTFKLEGTPTEIVNLHLVASGMIDKPKIRKIEDHRGTVTEAVREVRSVLFEGIGRKETKIYDPALLPVDARIEGPAVIEERTSVVIVYQGQSAHRDLYGNIIVSTGVK